MAEPRQPKVSLLIAVKNEAAFIQACVESALAQDYPRDRLEILVIDGRSTDATQAIVGELADRHPAVRLIDNPRVTQAAGWNIGIDQATGDVLGIVSGHAELGADYVSTAVESLNRTGADMVGGLMRAVGQTRTASAISLATSTPFGVGGAAFHYTDREQRVDTVYMGLARRETWARFKFDEEMIRDQDDELSYRMLDAGCVIVCNPEIRSRYFNRSTFRSLWKQYNDYGFWKVRVAQKHPRQVRMRHLAPALAVVSGASAMLMSPLFAMPRVALLTASTIYAAGAISFAVRAAARSDLSLAPLVAATFPVMHVAYGTGFIRGLIYFGVPRARETGRGSA